VNGEASTLEVLEIFESFGLRSVLTFRQFQTNAALPEKAFEFRVPVGVDVLKQ
jgi:outer membrane lipoprotein-sorting protein